MESQFQDRVVKPEAIFKFDEPKRQPIPEFKLDTQVDFTKSTGYANPSTDIKGVADKVKPAGIGDLQIDADLGKLEEGIKNIRKQQINEKIRNLINEAQRLITEQQYHKALEPLNQALEIEPASALTLFYIGYCFFELEDYHSAQKALEVARQHARDMETIVLILVLQASCVRKATEQIEMQLANLIEKGQFESAISLIEKELRQQPFNVAFLYHKCNLLLVTGKVMQAKQATIEAMGRVSKDNVQLFQELLHQITIHEHFPYLEKARIALRRGNPAEALKLLNPCRSVLAGFEQYEVTRAYAEEKNRSFLIAIFSRNNKWLTDSSRQKFFAWLLAEELNAGVSAMNEENFDRAAAAFTAAARIDSGCSIICYLHGVSIFKGFQQAFEKKDAAALNLDRSTQTLAAASKLLERACADPLVGKQSTNVRKIVDNHLSQLIDVKREIERQMQQVNDCVSKFNSIMGYLGKNPIRSLDELKAARSVFKDLEGQVARARSGQHENSGGMQVLDQLEEAIKNINKQLYN